MYNYNSYLKTLNCKEDPKKIAKVRKQQIHKRNLLSAKARNRYKHECLNFIEMVNKTQRDYIKLVDEKESKLGIKINARLRSTESRQTRKQSFKADRLKIKIPVQFRERNLSAESRRRRLGATLQGKSLLLTNSQSSSPDARMMTSQVFSGACLKSRNINGNPNLTTPSSKLALSQKILIDEMSEPYLGGHEEVGNKRRARRVMNEVSNDMFKTYTHSDPMYK